MESTENIQILKRNRIIALIKDISLHANKYSMDGILKLLKTILKEKFEKTVIIKNNPYFNFKSNEVESVTIKNDKIEILVNRFGIMHTDNIIPDEDIENFFVPEHSDNLIDDKVADFINVFNNRLLLLSFKISEKFIPSLSSTNFLDSFYGKILNALSGGILKNFSKTNIGYNNTNQLWASERTNANLKQLLETLTNLKVKISEPKGGFQKITEPLSFLGQHNNILSQNCYLGEYIFNPTKYIQIFICINNDKLLFFIFNQLEAIITFIRNYLHFVIDFKLYLKIEKQSIIPLDLKSKHVFLGINSFLATNDCDKYHNKIPITDKILNRVIKFK